MLGDGLERIEIHEVVNIEGGRQDRVDLLEGVLSMSRSRLGFSPAGSDMSLFRRSAGVGLFSFGGSLVGRYCSVVIALSSLGFTNGSVMRLDRRDGLASLMLFVQTLLMRDLRKEPSPHRPDSTEHP
ncbi:hypothetical protein BH11ACT6_BH11ACT6_12490 [soil metagenome]